jgi:hypothetical protein
MKLGRLTLTLAIAGIAANMFLKKRDGGAPTHPTSSTPRIRAMRAPR